MKLTTRLGLTVLAILLVSLPNARSQDKDSTGKDKTATIKDVSYYKQVRPLFQQHCQGCHQPSRDKGGFVMTTHASLFKQGDSGEFGIVKGQPNKSYLVERIIPHNGKRAEMPPEGDPLTDYQVKLIQTWIAEGATDDTPETAKVIVDADHPPVYNLPPVITSIDYSPDGKILAVAGYHEVVLHKADGSGRLARLIGAAEQISSVVFSPNGKLLAVTGGSPGRFGEVQIWDVRKHRLKLAKSITFDTVYGASWSKDGSIVAFGCADNSTRAINARTGEQVFFNGGHNDWVLDTVFSVKDDHLVTVSRDMSMKLSVVKTSRLVDNITSITPGALKGGLMTVDRHPTKDELVIGGSDGTPKIYKMFRTKARKIGDDYNLIRKFAAMPGRVYTVRYSHDGNKIICGSSDTGKGEIRIYDANKGNLLTKLKSITGPIYSAQFSPDGKVIASAGFEGVVRFHDAKTGTLIRELVPFPLREQQAKASQQQ
ncbi:MAG: c-type cytochrome domain-containing protein [Gemmataceae bacterium]